MSGYAWRHRNKQQGPCELHPPFLVDYGRWKASKPRRTLDVKKLGRLLTPERALYLCCALMVLYTPHYGRWMRWAQTMEAVLRAIASEYLKVLYTPHYGRLTLTTVG